MNPKNRNKLIEAIASGNKKKIREVKPPTRYVIICSEDDDRDYNSSSDSELEAIWRKGFSSDGPSIDPWVIKLGQ
ncbi:MAG: hypothetical protein WCI71_10840 [Bacteroidota bacterium]